MILLYIVEGKTNETEIVRTHQFRPDGTKTAIIIDIGAEKKYSNKVIEQKRRVWRKDKYFANLPYGCVHTDFQDTSIRNM